MKKYVWASFGAALVLVNLVAEAGGRMTGIEVPMLLRIALIVGVTAGGAALGGASLLVGKLEEEKPLAGAARDTLGPERAAGEGRKDGGEAP